MNKSSENKKSKDNSSIAANAENNKYKESNQKKKDQQSSNKSTVNKNSPMKCTHCGQDGHFAIKCIKKPQGGATKVNQRIRLVVKNVNLTI